MAGKIISGILIVIFLACLPFLVLLDNMVKTNIMVDTSRTALDNFKIDIQDGIEKLAKSMSKTSNKVVDNLTLDIEDGLEKMAKNMSRTSKKVADNLTLDIEDAKEKMEKDLNTVYKAIVNNDNRKNIKNVSKEDLCTQISSAFEDINFSKFCRPKED